ncbi:MAG: hypothetical protein H6904_04970 [Rhodobacteraceae bacterium]|nr:hypothetical protein [Defluviimonas sp.]MCP5376409.1 hypothetical protein [Paracoccaceae bacterium]
MGLTDFLVAAAGLGRWVLPVGLATGVLMPGTAAILKPWLPEMAAALLFMSAFRIGIRQGIGSVRDLGRTVAILAVMQFAVPAATAGGLGALSVPATPAIAAVLLVLAGSSISGAPNICALLGHHPALALRLLLVGTALLPLSVLAVFALWPALMGGRDVLPPVLRLMAAILGGGTAGFALRAAVERQLTPRRIAAIDGASIVLLAVMVVGLMAEVGPALRDRPATLAGWLAFACALNFGLQIVTARALRGTVLGPDAGTIAVIAGNRNVALFLIALPEDVIAPLLIFIGCYQIPMFLTPLLMGRFVGAAPRP